MCWNDKLETLTQKPWLEIVVVYFSIVENLLLVNFELSATLVSSPV